MCARLRVTSPEGIAPIVCNVNLGEHIFKNGEQRANTVHLNLVPTLGKYCEQNFCCMVVLVSYDNLKEVVGQN